MKPPKDVSSLAERLQSSMTTPPLTIAKTEPAINPTAATSVKAAKAEPAAKGSASVFLRVPNALYEKLAREAMARTKATGKGVTIQQVILAKLEGGHA